MSKEALEKLGVTQDNFDEHFFNVQKNGPKKGQVMVRYAAIADFVDGRLKRDVINLLSAKKGGTGVVKVMRVMAGAIEEDALRIPLEMARELVNGVDEDVIAKKPYKLNVEYFFYTEKKHAEAVTADDPHWEKINLIDMDQFRENCKKLDEMSEKADVAEEIVN